MKRLEEKKANRESRRAKNAGRFRLVLVVSCLLLALIFVGAKFYRQSKEGAELDKQIAQLEMEIEQQEKEKEHYENVTELRKTEEHQKQIAKERLGLVEENEKVFIDVAGE